MLTLCSLCIQTFWQQQSLTRTYRTSRFIHLWPVTPHCTNCILVSKITNNFKRPWFDVDLKMTPTHKDHQHNHTIQHYCIEKTLKTSKTISINRNSGLIPKLLQIDTICKLRRSAKPTTVCTKHWQSLHVIHSTLSDTTKHDKSSTSGTAASQQAGQLEAFAATLPHCPLSIG